VTCVATHPDYRGDGRGEHLINLLEAEARELGIAAIFVLTTQSTHWFREKGFEEQPMSVLPEQRKALYNLQRNSKVLLRRISQA